MWSNHLRPLLSVAMGFNHIEVLQEHVINALLDSESSAPEHLLMCFRMLLKEIKSTPSICPEGLMARLKCSEACLFGADGIAACQGLACHPCLVCVRASVASWQLACWHGSLQWAIHHPSTAVAIPWPRVLLCWGTANGRQHSRSCASGSLAACPFGSHYYLHCSLLMWQVG
jgi:hypothetical protein